jgi:molybdenum cofactor cytidylyltransferase
VSARIAAIVLAAGRSSRMAPRNKLLEPVEGRPIVAHVAGVALAVGADPVIVVTGFDPKRIEDTLQGLSVELAHNREFAEGMSGSIRTGLCALPPDRDAALILLGDMPEVEASDLKALIAAFAQEGRDAVCIPVRGGKRGNPVLWGSSYFAEMKQISGDRGAKGLIAKYGDHVVEVPAASDGIFADVDTSEDFARLEKKIGSKP